MFKVKDMITERIKFSEIFDETRCKQIAEEYELDTNGETEFIRKGYICKAEDMEIKDGERAVIKYVSTASVDRDGEILMPDGADLKDFRRNPVVLFAHDYGKLPIGRDQWIKVDGKGIKAKTIYASAEANPLAEQVYQLQKEGILRTSSVGFIPLKVSERGTDDYEKAVEKIEAVHGIPESKSRKASRIYEKWILLEHSDVPVPSNPDALNLAITKGMNISEEMKEQIGEYLETEETPEPDYKALAERYEELNDDLYDRNEELQGVIDDLLEPEGNKKLTDELAVLRTLSRKQAGTLAHQETYIDYLTGRIFRFDDESGGTKSSIFPIVSDVDESVLTLRSVADIIPGILKKRNEHFITTINNAIALATGKAI